MGSFGFEQARVASHLPLRLLPQVYILTTVTAMNVQMNIEFFCFYEVTWAMVFQSYSAI